MDDVTALEAHDLYRFYHVGDDEVLALRAACPLPFNQKNRVRS